MWTRAPDSSNWSRWIVPGGGVDPGETHEEAAKREVLEETGLVVADVGSKIYEERIPLPYDDAIFPGAHQQFFALAVDTEFEISTAGWTESEHIDVTAWRWWSLEELTHTSDPFEPRHLPGILERLFSTVKGPVQ